MWGTSISAKATIDELTRRPLLFITPLSGHSGRGRTCCWLDPVAIDPGQWTPVQSSLPAYRSGVVLDFRSVYIARRGLACSPPIRRQKQRASDAGRLSYFIGRVLRLEVPL